MNIELTSLETLLTEKPMHYQFVVDADLVHVGGGSAVSDF